MRLKYLYIFIIVLSILIPQSNDQDDSSNSSKEKKKWSLFKKKDKDEDVGVDGSDSDKKDKKKRGLFRRKNKKDYKEKDERTGPFGIFKKKRKKDAEDDIWSTKEEREKQEELDGQTIVRIPYTPIDGTDEVLSSSESKPANLSASNEEEQQQVTSQETEISESPETSNENQETAKQEQEETVDEEKVQPSWPFILSNSTDEDNQVVLNSSTAENPEANVSMSEISLTSESNTIMQEDSPENILESQLLETMIAQNEKIDKLLESINADKSHVRIDEEGPSSDGNLNSGESQDMLELLQIVQNKFFEIENMVSGSDSLYLGAHDEIRNIKIKMESMNMRLETKIQSLELSLGLLEGDLSVRVDSLEKNMSSRDGRIDELEDLNKDLVLQMLRLDNKLVAKVIKLENKILELDSGFENLKGLNKDLVFNVLNQSSSSAPPSTENFNNSTGPLKISKSEYKKRYDEAYMKYLDGDYQKSLSMFLSLLKLENRNDLTDNCQYWIGEIYYATRDFSDAIEAFSKVFNYEDNNKKSYSQYKLGLCYLNINEKQKAVKAFQKVVDNYSKQSDLVRKSQKFINKYK